MRKKTAFLILLMVIGSLFISCKGKAEEAATPTSVPLPTPTTAADRVVLITGDVQDAWTLQQANTILQELATSSNLVFETRTAIQSNEITPDVKVLVFLSHPQNLGSLSNSASGTQFIVISDQEWTPESNVTIIRSDPTNQIFMAGFASVMLADNFRGGGLLTSENSNLITAYKNGSKYFCGLCNALITPLNKYPITKEITQSSQPADWIAAFDEINLNTILYVFVPPQAYSAELFNHIAQTSVKVIGITNPPAEAQSIWAGTILSDGLTPIKAIWNDVLAGNGGKTINASLYLADMQTGFISPGKQQLLQQVITELQAGRIYTLDPMAE
ncbi:MAG: hypothetical protein AB2L18_04510 [Anaerolineaceae bacterium]